MTPEERDKMYNKVYDSFLDLINKKIDVLNIPTHLMAELTRIRPRGAWERVTMEWYNYGDILRELCGQNNIVQTYDVFSDEFVFKRGEK